MKKIALSIVSLFCVAQSAMAGTTIARTPAEVAKALESTPELLTRVNAMSAAYGPQIVTSLTVSEGCRTWKTKEYNYSSEDSYWETHTACSRTSTATLRDANGNEQQIVIAVDLRK